MQESSADGAEKDRFRARAVSLYDYLAEHATGSVRNQAVILRYNLLMDRPIYMGRNTWQPPSD